MAHWRLYTAVLPRYTQHVENSSSRSASIFASIKVESLPVEQIIGVPMIVLLR